LKTIKFSYDNSSTQRLTLGSVVESGKKAYLFSYDNIGSLPDYLANKSDHWGFYNNTYANLDYSNYYSYRNPNATYTKYGVLNKITYPTGGYTEFEFESHNYRKQLNMERWKLPLVNYSSNQLAGGLRIKQIRNSDTSNGPAQLVKEYYYVSDYLQNKANAVQSSGVLGGQIQYYFTDYIVYAFNENDIKKKMSVFSSNSVLPSCHNTNGSHLGYTEVIEKGPDNSFTRYQFTNFDNGYMDEAADAIIQFSRTPYEAYASKASDRGLLILQEDYNAEGIKLKSKSITYEKDANANNYVRAMNASYRNVCPNSAVSYDEGTVYKIYTYLLRPLTESESYYDPASGNSLQTSNISYAYTTKKLIRSVSTQNSDGKEYMKRYKYTGDYDLVATNGADKLVFNYMMIRNMIGYPAEEQAFEKINGNWNVLESRLIRYLFPLGELTAGGAVCPKEEYLLEISAPVANFEESKLHSSGILQINSNYKKRIIYEYDYYGNPNQISKDSINTVYLWGYNHQYLVAEIKNATYSTVKQILTETLINRVANAATPTASDLTAINNLRTNTTLKDAHITTCTYKPLVGMLTSKDPRGVETQYVYDTFGRLTRVILDGKTIEEYQYNYKN
jgi:YD repeat-containing protein